MAEGISGRRVKKSQYFGSSDKKSWSSKAGDLKGWLEEYWILHGRTRSRIGACAMVGSLVVGDGVLLVLSKDPVQGIMKLNIKNSTNHVSL